MDSGASGFILPVNFHSLYYQGTTKEDNVIDLGLSLRVMQPQQFQPGKQLVSYKEYRDLTGLSQLKSQITGNLEYDKTVVNEDCEDEEGGIQSRERWTYVKVNMDGVIVGRKICILDHGGYSSLALKLEDLFGSKSLSGLRLFQAESEFSLFYKDIKGNWRTVGDVTWNEFVECVKRLRIVPKTQASISFH